MKLLVNLCAHDGVVSHYAGVGTIVKRYIEAFATLLNDKGIDYDFNLFTPEYYEGCFGYSEFTKQTHEKMKNTKIYMLSNGTDAKLSYGTPDNWKILSNNTARMINEIDKSKYDFVLTIANDTPYAGLSSMLDKDDNHKCVWIPHSTGRIHKVDSSIENSDLILLDRLKWEEDAISYINEDKNSYLGSTGKYIEKHLIDEYGLDKNKSIYIINGEIMSHKTTYDEGEETVALFNEIKDYDKIILAFGRAEAYKNLDATMYLGNELGIKPVVIAQGYFKGQPLIKELEDIALKTDTKLFVDAPFYLAQYIVNHFDKPMIMLIPSKKEIVGLIVNEIRKLNKDNVLIVANDIGGLHEQINSGVDGVLVDLENIKESALEIKKYFDLDTMKEFNKNSQHRLYEEYDFIKICDKFLKEIIGERYE